MDEGQLSRPRLLVTGAGGFCGEHACRYFTSAGWDVTAVVRRMPVDDQAEEFLGQAAAVEICDLASASGTMEMVRRAQPDYVLHLAGVNAVALSWSSPAAVMESNVMGTVHLLEAIRGLGNRKCCRIVVAGSMLRCKLDEGGQGMAPPHPYSLSKAMQVLTAQSWASLYGMDVIVAEPSNLIGPGRSNGLCALIARYAAELERNGSGECRATNCCGDDAAGRGGDDDAEHSGGDDAERGGVDDAECGGVDDAECSGGGDVSSVDHSADGGAPPPFRLSSRTEMRDLLDVRDAIRAYELLLLSGERGMVYPVASGTMRSLGELADTFDRLASCSLQWCVGESQELSPQPLDIAAVRALGWSPRFSLEQSVLDTLESARRVLKEGM
ncbi:NAD-dependent epimerase/dehydratase family protein [Paenibacillus oenotherae]|uniref:NAD-dependent epimerase/dehydratase family protein n=1 Tax=Paenibacillus oenotherae TaxID=1435645 RepID=A0ABS7D3L9_9BACL|nr:NAD-dependent epimerase/dehydratase family protein [Paenibacillus oenotherae]MBW7474532.1 NAD-dependent epimerase/dehydratase family protein [Paenibacillus oenotherae]